MLGVSGLDIMSKNTTAKPKLLRVIDRYDLDGMGDELVDRWTKPEPTRQSCRELAEFFNVRVLDAALRAEGILWDKPLVQECAVIIDDDDRSLTGFDIRNRGVDVDAVGEDMVSYQSIHTYLTDIRGIDYEQELNGIRDRINNLQQMQSKMETVASNTARRSIDHDQINGAEPTIKITAEYVCKACESGTDVTQYLRNRGCPVCDNSNSKFC